MKSDPSPIMGAMNDSTKAKLNTLLTYLVALAVGAAGGVVGMRPTPTKTYTLPAGKVTSVVITGPATLGELGDGGVLIRSAWPLEVRDMAPAPVAPVGSGS